MPNTDDSSPQTRPTLHRAIEAEIPAKSDLGDFSSRPSSRPPGLLEIVGLPILGAILIELLRSRKNELILFFIPFVVAGVRLFIAQFQVPPSRDRGDENQRTTRAKRLSVGFNQVAVFVLVLFEAGFVMACTPDFPRELWFVIIGIFATYVALRLQSRTYWMRAAIDPASLETPV